MVSWPVGYDLVILKETDSTNKEAIRRIGSSKKPTWIITEIQTEGKGRRGRTWLMPKGNFAATLMLKPNTPGVFIKLKTKKIGSVRSSLQIRPSCKI